jgi:L-fucose mutarotase/ribose pyranase (RbsD/FucU family)
MPPLKAELSRNFSRDAIGLLTRAGHNRLLVICDTSFDVPDGAPEFYYLGNKRGDISAAAALQEIAAACPLDLAVPARFMLPDADDTADHTAPPRNQAAIEALAIAAKGLVRQGSEGFYQFSKGSDPAKPTIYCLTASDFAYDNIAVSLGHSQR